MENMRKNQDQRVNKEKTKSDTTSTMNKKPYYSGPRITIAGLRISLWANGTDLVSGPQFCGAKSGR
jgi:hypothetical protein